MSGLFDTGAEVTLADVSVPGAEAWPRVSFINIPVTVDGTPLRVRGAVRVTLEVDGVSVPDHVVYLVEGLGVSCLLGTDVMARLPGVIVLDLKQKLVTIGSRQDDLKGVDRSGSDNLSSVRTDRRTDPTVPVGCGDRVQGGVPSKVVARVRLASPAVIPAGHEVLLRAQVDAEVAGSGQACLVEPYQSLSRKEGLIGARALVTPEDSMVQVRFVNISGRAISLKSGTALAKVEVLPSNPVVSSVVEDDSDLDLMSGRPNEVTGSEMQMLEDMVKGSEVSGDERVSLRAHLRRNRDVFSLKGEIGCTPMVEHKIYTLDHHPIRQQPRRVPHHLLGEVDRQLDEMLDQGLIQESTSPWASPVVLAKKKNGEVRFCIDYRGLNMISRHDAYPIPRVDDALGSLKGARWFSTLDLASAYWQIPMDPESSQKAAFTTHRGLFEPKRMPFGLRSAPATMQRLMSTLFKSMTWKMVLVYLDDIVIYSDTVEQHLKRMDLVFAKIREAKLKLKPSKCHFLRESVEYLGHVVSSSGVSTSPRVVQAVMEYAQPQDVSGVRRFLGLAGYYRPFVPEFSDIAEPLVHLTRKGVEFVWGEGCEGAFRKLKGLIVTAPVLHFPDFSIPFHLTTDASDVGVAGVLSQQVEGLDCPVGYFSSCLSRAQRNYSVTERECLAIVEAIKHFDMFLAGAPFVVHTDHRPLSYLQALKEPRGRLARWILFLNSYEFDIQYRPGVDIPHADALSRGSSEKVMTTVLEPRWSPEVLREAQERDPVIGRVLYLVRMGKECQGGRESKKVRQLLRQRKQLSRTEQGVLVVRSPKGQSQVVLPAQLVREVLAVAHDGPTSGHLGIDKTLEKVRERFYWPTLFNDVGRYCRTCLSCQNRKDPVKARQAPLQKMPVPTRPFEWVSIDHTGPLPTSASGNKYILVISCHFSKWIECIAVPTMEASVVAEVVAREVVCRYGVPLRLHSDQGRSFEAAVIRNLCRSLGMEKSRTSPYHPQCNGETERFNSTVKTMLSHYVDQLNQRDWDVYLPFMLFAYRTSQHAVTKFSPYELVFCRSPHLPLDCLFGVQGPKPANPIGKVWELQKRIPEVMKMVRAHIHAGQDMRNARRNPEDFKPYQVGDQVMVRNSKTRKGCTRKLRREQWQGPYVVKKVITEVNYRLGCGRKTILAHYNRLKPFAERTVEDEQFSEVSQTDEQPDIDDVVDQGGEPDTDECDRFDVDETLDTTGTFDDDDHFDDHDPGLDVTGVNQPAPGDQPVIVPPVEHQEPLMREGGRLWCNINPENVVHGRRRR